MLEAFSAYIKNIAVFTLFAAFAQLIMPENNFKKYLNFIMGLLLLIAAFQPILSLFQKQIQYEIDQQIIQIEREIQK